MNGVREKERESNHSVTEPFEDFFIRRDLKHADTSIFLIFIRLFRRLSGTFSLPLDGDKWVVVRG